MKCASVLVPRGIAATRVALRGETVLPQKAQGKRGMRGINPSPWESLQQPGSITLIPACPLQPQSSGGKGGCKRVAAALQRQSARKRIAPADLGRGMEIIWGLEREMGKSSTAELSVGTLPREALSCRPRERKLPSPDLS